MPVMDVVSSLLQLERQTDMRKILVTTSVVFLAFCSFSQGTVTFANASTTAGLIPADRTVSFWAWYDNGIYLEPRTLGNVSSNFAGVDMSGLRVAVLYAPTTVTDLASFSLGRFSGGYPTFKASTSGTTGSWFGKTATLDGVTAGQTVNMAAVVWDIREAASPFDRAAQYGPWGSSAIFQYTVPGGSTPAPQEFLPQNLRAFSVGPFPYWVPEPTGSALLSVGAAMMLIFRRPKAPPV